MSSLRDHRGLRVGLAAVALCLAGCRAVGGGAPVRHAFGALEVSVPAGWTVEFGRLGQFADGTKAGPSDKSSVEFKGPDGQFLHIADERFGVSGIWDADSWWTLRVLDDGS